MNKIFSTVLIIFILTGCATAQLAPTPAAPSATAHPTFIFPIPETPTVVPLNVSPDVKAVLDAQKAPYKVDAQGNAVVDLQDTATQEKIVLNKITDTKTNDGLAKDIVTGYDKDGNRLIFVENFGWVKDIPAGTFDKPTVVADNLPMQVLNTVTALHYAENPTIPTTAITPDFWMNVTGNHTVVLGELGFFPAYGAPLLIKPKDVFGTHNIPFVLFPPYQQNGVVLVPRPTLNGLDKNGQQIITNWFFWF